MKELTKICTNCGVEKTATSEYFAKDKGGKYGFRGRCKDCDKIFRKKHYQENHEVIRKKQNSYLRKYYQENKERISLYKKQYYAGKKSNH